MSSKYCKSSLVQQAKNYYLQHDYANALKIYEQLACQIGIDYFHANIKLCHKKVKNKVDISVIIPAFNVERYISRAFDSILTQTQKNIEIIVFDDKSTDSTLEIIEKYQIKHANIKLIKSKINVGQGKGRNEALKIVSGEFVTFLDADDYFENKYYFQQILQIAKNYNVDIVITPYIRESNGIIKRDKIKECVMPANDAAKKFISREFGTHGPGAKLFKSETLDGASFVEYGYSQDVLFTLKAINNANSVYSLNLYSYTYFQDNNSSWRPQQLTDKHFFSSIRLLFELLYEFLILKKEGNHWEIKDFIRTWQKDHEPRLLAYLKDRVDYNFACCIVNLVGHNLFFILASIKSEELKSIFVKLHNTTYEKNINTIGYLAYLENVISNIENYISKYAIEAKTHYKKETVVIYTKTLSSGGLERVAAELGRSLSEVYDVVYLLDDVQTQDFEFYGKILKLDLFDINIIEVLHNSKYIFDFKFKGLNCEFPLCFYCIKKFSHKYISTIHNTKTCKNYFEAIQTYLHEKKLASLHSIICVSRTVKENFEAIYGQSENIQIVHNPIDFGKISKAQYFENKQKKYILCACRLNATQHKGLDILIQAFAQSNAKNEYQLVLAGDGNLDPKLEEFIVTAKLCENIKIVGFQKNIYEYMKQAHFSIITSRWEGFSMALVESLACGTPVLTTRVGVAPEIIRHKMNGYFIDIEDINSTAQGIDYMAKFCSSMRPKCKTSVQQFSIENYKKIIFSIIH